MRLVATYFSILVLLMASLPALAQPDERPPEDDLAPVVTLTPIRKWYVTNAMDGAIFSTSILDKPGKDRYLSTLRFSYFFNVGLHFNYNYDEHFGIYTGVGIRNIGLIEKNGDTTIKRRVYTLNVPVGFKIGNLGKKNYLILGGGIDVPFNYREKRYTERRDKEIFNEWFTDRTPSVMPYLQLGAMFNPGIALNVQFFPNNFFNTDYTETVNGTVVKPYKGYDARLLHLTLGINIKLTPKKTYVAPAPEVPETEATDEDE